MTQITPIMCYSIYQGMKLHFSGQGNYDYFKYGGKVSISEEVFKHKKEHYTFAALAKRYNEENYKDLVLSNILRKPNIYCRELLSDDSKATMMEYQKRIGSLTYNFSQDIFHLLDITEKEKVSMDDLLRVEEGQQPPLLKQYEWRVISLETLIILDDILGFFKYWDRRIQDKIIWPGIRDLCVKYRPFLHYDKAAFTKILKEKL